MTSPNNTQTFVLVGDFKDNITPKLTKLSRELKSLTDNFARLSKKLRPISREFGNMAGSAERMAEALKSQRGSLDSSVRSMSQYRREAGKVRAANEHLARSQSKLAVSAAKVRAATGQAAVPREVARMLRNQRHGGKGKGGSHGGSLSDVAAGTAFGVTLGHQLGEGIARGMEYGFHQGVKLIEKPFHYLAHEFKHAVSEEMADITAAGSMYALDKSAKTKMFKDFEDARASQEALDQRLAMSASRLPGETLEYVHQARQLQDTVMQALGKNKDEFMKVAEAQGAVAGDMKDAFATVLSGFTEKAVLLGMGSGGRSGGMGVPQLLEQMVGSDNVKVESMARVYGALRDNPLLRAALERNQDAINKTTKGSIERIEAVNKALKEALPQEVITAMTMTMEGIGQGLKSSIFDIAAGWFGIRRMIKGVETATYKMNGEIKKSTNSMLSLFDVLRDSIGFFVAPLLEITQILPQIYEPMEGLMKSLFPLRDLGAKFTYNFNQWALAYERFAKETFTDLKTQTKFLETRGPRAAFKTLAELLHSFDENFDTTGITAELLKVDADFGKIGKQLFDELMKSDFMDFVGETIGYFISELLAVMANLVTGVTDTLNGSKFAQGLQRGLNGRVDKDGKKIGMAAWEAVQKIFNGVFKLLGNALITVVTKLPIQTALYVAITAILPAAITGFGSKIGEALSAVIGKATATAVKAITGVGNSLPGGGGGSGTYRGRPQRYGRGGSIDRLNRLRRYKMSKRAEFVGDLGGLGYNMMGAPGSKTMARMRKSMGRVGKTVGRMGRFVPGGALAMGALDAGMSIAGGESPAKAIGSAIASTVGAAVGTAFGPVGTMIGGTAGSLLFDWASKALSGPKTAQEKAAAAQAAAAEAMNNATNAANTRFLKEGQGLGGIEALSQHFGGGTGLMAALNDPAKLKQMGLSPEEVQQSKILAGYMTQLNAAAEARVSAENIATAAEQANTNNKEALRAKADEAAKAQIDLETKMRAAWETTSTSSQTKLLTAAGAMAQAIEQAANKLRRGSGLNTPGSVDMNATSTPNRSNRRNNVTSPGGLAAPAFGGTPAKRMGLAEAIQSEMKNKPAGSHLVIANSSETVIPAAGGYSPLGNMANALVKFIGPLNALSSLADSVMADGLLGNVSGSLGAAAALAKSYGLTMTSFKRSGPANASYHNVGRAMDFSNSTGPTPQMLAFAQAMASKYGSSMAELIYTPLGFGIKHGKRVPPYAVAGHYNHVHVAFGRGPGMPTMFTNARAAAAYEGMMAPAGARVATVTANSSEFGGGTTNVTQNITINGADDPRRLAEMVFNYAAQAAQHVNNSSFA